jgi:hypothetical protein
MVKDGLDALVAILNAVSLEHLETTTFFEFGHSASDAMSLLYCLRGGVIARQEQRERVRRGEPKPGDLGPIDL